MLLSAKRALVGFVTARTDESFHDDLLKVAGRQAGPNQPNNLSTIYWAFFSWIANDIAILRSGFFFLYIHTNTCVNSAMVR